MKKITRIIVSGDLLRVKLIDGAPTNFHEKRINKYFDFFKYQLGEATKLAVEKLNTDNTDFDPAYMYELCGIPYNGDNEWLKIYDMRVVPDHAVNYYGKYICDSLVIYIEMPLIFKKIHALLDVPYIDLTVHPIRFLDDHLFGMSTNCFWIFDRLKKYQVDENQFYIQANMIKAIADYNPLPIVENSVLIAGQTNVDKALYSDGRCLSIMDFKNKIEELGEKYSLVYYKAHPYNTNLRKIHDFLKNYSFVKLCPSDWNIYKILSHPNLKKVCAITSGVLYEAPYFGKEAESFYHPYLHLDYSKNCAYSETTYLSIYNDFINPVFWKNVLQDVVEVNPDCKDIEPVIRPNRLRATFNDYWSYTELDPAIITTNKIYDTRLRAVERSVKEGIGIKDGSEAGRILALTNKVNLLETQLEILRNDPCFEKSIIRRNVKKLAFFLSQNSYYFNSIFVLMKLKREAELYQEEPTQITSLKGITYRPHAPHGGRGGGGAVLSAMEAVLGKNVAGYAITYNYSERDGIWHTLKNRYFSYRNYQRFINPKSNLLPLYAAITFAIEKTRYETGKLYVCHEYATAYGLALLHKKYILVIHSQGTRVDEKITLGEKLKKCEVWTVQNCEKYAIENALYVCFPSKGALESYFSSGYNKADRKKANIGPILYNTLYADVRPGNVDDVMRDDTIITFLSVGTVTFAKGQDRVCRFLESILKQEKFKRIRWICVGKGPMYDELAKCTDKLRAGYKNFEFISYEKLKFNEVQYLYTISDIYIMLHRLSIFDLATLEAMKNGCAIFLSELGGNLEYNLEDNIIFTDERADNISQYLEHNALEQLKAKNKKVYEDVFSEKCFKERYTELLVNAISECNGSKD